MTTERTLTPEAEAAIQADSVGMVYLVELGWASGTQRLCTDIRDVVWAGQTWAGVGHVGGISAVEETGDIQPSGVTLTLKSGIYTATALEETNWQGRPMRLWSALVDPDSGAVIDAVPLFAGRMDRMPMVFGKDGKVSLHCENRLNDFRRTNSARFTDADQRARYPGDTALRHINTTNERVLSWGS